MRMLEKNVEQDEMNCRKEGRSTFSKVPCEDAVKWAFSILMSLCGLLAFQQLDDCENTMKWVFSILLSLCVLPAVPTFQQGDNCEDTMKCAFSILL